MIHPKQKDQRTRGTNCGRLRAGWIFNTPWDQAAQWPAVSGKTRTRAKCLGSITASGNDILCTGALCDSIEMDSGNKGLVRAEG